MTHNVGTAVYFRFFLLFFLSFSLDRSLIIYIIIVLRLLASVVIQKEKYLTYLHGH